LITSVGNKYWQDLTPKAGNFRGNYTEISQEMVEFIAFEESFKNDPLIAENIPVVYISALFILEEHRSKGLAQRLMKLPEDFAKEKNIKFLKLLMFTKNQLARDFYFKWGFEDYESTMIKEIRLLN